MDPLLRYAFIASIAGHVAAGAALHPRERTPEPLTVIVARLQAPVAAVQELPPAASKPRLTRAAPAPASPRPAPRRSVIALAATVPAPANVSVAAVALPEAASADPAAVAAAVAGPPAALEPPRFNAAYLANPPPPYPPSARRRGIEGTVTIEVRVGVAGEAKELKLVASAGDAVLDSAAIEAIRSWRFVPARRGEQAVEAWVRIPMVFRLN